MLNYPDAGPADDGKAIDPACGARTYEGHKGTDIAIADAAAMKRGVNVLAARDGTVLRVRDGEDDHFPISAEQLDTIKANQKECGNAVLIDHGDGWQGMYCHMKRGSIAVQPQQKIKAGEKIGQVGASGMTEFPHIHLGLTKDGKIMDPFTGRDLSEPCGPSSTSLFTKSSGLSYQPLSFMHTGFYSAPVTLDQIDQGIKAPDTLSSNADALVFYAVLLGVRDGDNITLKIMGPDQKVFAETKHTMDKNRARQMLFVGRKIPESSPLPEGLYTASVDVVRKHAGKDAETFSNIKTITIEKTQ